MKKRVLNVTPQGDFESQYGHFYKWEIEFDDMTAEYLSKSENQNKFVEGQEIDVEITTIIITITKGPTSKYINITRISIHTK